MPLLNAVVMCRTAFFTTGIPTILSNVAWVLQFINAGRNPPFASKMELFVFTCRCGMESMRHVNNGTTGADDAFIVEAFLDPADTRPMESDV